MTPSDTASQTYRSMTPHGELVLTIERGDRTRAALMLEGTFLMDSRVAEGEVELARRAFAFRSEQAGSRKERGLRVLVGGLGLGITLAAVLKMPGVGRVDVVEIFSAVVEWNRAPLAPFNRNALADARVRVYEMDLRRFLLAREEGEERYDLLLLDIDNGPTWLSLPDNRWLYEKEGIAALRARAETGGVIAFWATERSKEFERALESEKWAETRREAVHIPLDAHRSFEDILYLVRV
ncbi:MAG: spermine/spermidine synthase [Candidatus Eisenbacteria bacterium]|nr:spermine/spermidine synthase [Candidatus Eisenbacteria bacterium]